MSALAAVALGTWPAGATDLQVNLSGANGVVRTTEPGLTCADDGKGSYRHYSVEAPLAPGALSKLAGSARSTLDIHYDGAKALTGGGPNAFLLGGESHVTLANQRGSVQVALRAGSCTAPALAFDGTTANLAGGAWATGDVAGSGAYRQATGSGTYTFSAEANPGADNAWSLKLNGSIAVLQPGLTVKVERTYWGNLGLDYVTRVVTVVYRIANTGPGDSFGSRFKGAASLTTGVRACGEPQGLLSSCPAGAPPEQPLGDLQSCPDSTIPSTCDSELVSVRYRVDLLGPCALILLGCQFNANVQVELPDALDVATTKSATVPVRAPDLPPPL
ncbi:MAG: hypothetical protein ACR2MO_08290 [Acidimicrobiales bacterium]